MAATDLQEKTMDATCNDLSGEQLHISGKHVTFNVPLEYLRFENLANHKTTSLSWKTI